MAKKINIAEVLKNCPTGMGLDCTIYDDVKFVSLHTRCKFPIVIRAYNGYTFRLTKYGQVHKDDDAKCVIFPKGRNTWEGFVPPHQLTQEEKDLLLKDLCGRLLYGVKISVDDRIHSLESINVFDKTIRYFCFFSCDIHEVKPYLFPLSSMTEEQQKEFSQLFKRELKAINDEIDPTQATAFEIEFYHKHHLDWRGLIPMGLAIDATDLNIYKNEEL